MFRGILLLVVLVSPFSLFAEETRGVVPGTITSETILSPNWKCDYVHKRILEVPADGSLDAVGPLCRATVHCDGRGPEAEFEKDLNITCRASGRDGCPDLRDCARDHDDPKKEFGMENGLVATKGIDAVQEKDGAICKYANQKNSSVVFWKLKDKATSNHVCSSRSECTLADGRYYTRMVSCAPAGKAKVNGEYVQICPQLYDCMAKETARPATTKQEFAATLSRGKPASSLGKQSPGSSTESTFTGGTSSAAGHRAFKP